MSMLCSKCHERMAVLFMTQMENNEMKNSGLCLKCAKEMNIPQVQEFIDKMGISDEDIEAMSSQMSDMLGGDVDWDSMNPEDFGEASKTFFQNMFSNQNQMPNEPPQEEEEIVIEPISKQENEPVSSRSSASKEEKDKKKESRRKHKFLDSFCENLSNKAKEGRIDTIVGRDREIQRVVQILNRRTKNNPVLIGEPGVGKTAIAEGIALRLSKGEVPHSLKNKELYLLDLTALVAGTQFRGQFESRVKGLLQEIKEAGNIILFIDEVHNIVGAGDSEGSMNAANILKPALSRGEIQVIGATTFNEYRKYIEKDSALERRFQPIKVDEPTIDDTVKVLEGIKSYYEEYHRVHISDEIVKNCVVLSERYITDRFLPDKAIDLLDESCSYATLNNKALEEHDELNEEMATILEELELFENNTPELSDKDYERLAELRAEKLRITEKLRKLEPAVLSATVTHEDLAQVLEIWTGIPASKIQEAELKKVSNLEKVMKSRVIGQDQAVELVAAAVRRSRVQINGKRRPASFIFVGPTGVGKTELVKVLSQEMFDSTDPLIRLDMSEYMEKHSVSRMIGSPPGYVGYDEAGQLTEKIRRKPYSVVLFDEIEKAHPDVLNILLQILDEGHITDAQGRNINFENTVIVMTSNAGNHRKSTAPLGFDRASEELAQEKTYQALSQFLRPEFLGRVDEIVAFGPLNLENYQQIAGLMLQELVAPLAEKGIVFQYDDLATHGIAKKAFGSKSGARDLRRVIRKEVEDHIANMILENVENPPARIELTAKDDELTLSATSNLFRVPYPANTRKD